MTIQKGVFAEKVETEEVQRPSNNKRFANANANKMSIKHKLISVNDSEVLSD
ncbi:hypothetical protein Bhyg_01204 [Pseudolycoriella hygida]|uniref:Uncharacterized protein n=1 Tax=Pseudolycoriella hygida TaxID=35572 RepID=A0A9Q0S759_9DIPT|nr:hypothetical protein Bhyg_01204 [Pseudolycoriella hygida]